MKLHKHQEHSHRESHQEHPPRLARLDRNAQARQKFHAARKETTPTAPRLATCPHGGVHLAGEACTLPYEVSIHEFIVWRGQRDANAPANAPARAENFIGMVHPRQAEEIGRELKARQDAGQIEKYVVRSLGQVYQDEAFERALEWISVFGPAVREPDGPPARARDAMAWPPVA